MTKRARVALEDCTIAVRRHTRDLQGNELRISWVSIVSLLRAVGHVLREVDRNKSLEMRQAIDEWWAAMRQDKSTAPIFWEFIQKERASVLKKYQLGFRRSLVIPGPLFQRRKTKVSINWTEIRGGRIESEEADVRSAMVGGPFEGKDEKELASEACAWWEGELNSIDVRASDLASGHR